MMKLSITYLYTIATYGYPPPIEGVFKALADIQAMGFHYLEMEALGPEHGEQVYAHRHELSRSLTDHGIEVHNFCIVDPDLVSLEDGRRTAAYERFKRFAELAVDLGTTTLHLASYAPPVEYLDEAPYQLGQDYHFANIPRLRLPAGFDWRRVWAVLVESSRQAAEIARQYDRIVLMEPRVGEVVCSPDSLVRLIDDVDMPNFKANFDTAHFSAQRENVVLALAKLENQFANVHLADNDPAHTGHLPLGEGTIDWIEFFRTLKQQKYDGYLGLDLGPSPTLQEDLLRSVAFVREVTGKVGIEIKW